MTGATGGVVSRSGHVLGFVLALESVAEWQHHSPFYLQSQPQPPLSWQNTVLSAGTLPLVEAMSSTTLAPGAFVIVSIAIVSVVAIVAMVAIVSGITRWLWQRYHRPRESPPLSSLAADLDDHVAAALGPGTGSHLETPPTVRRLERVDDDPAGPAAGTATPIVPVIRIDLGTADTPGLGLVLEYVAAALETVHPVLEGDECECKCAFDEGERDVRPRYYEFEVTFGPDGLLVSGECRRIVVPPTCAEQLCSESRYGVHELQRELEDGAGGEDVPSVLWESC
ncbi:hypothetical protein [Natrialba sp. SSL1]|uniref:hypothetical protein n=1 Tax=Natrialba sp. SSL1 TaxID=1869245 RepID=UPI0008F85C31|nr:hypothetical protein [Natrialba sp. SSL1]OIB58242.1 hypothetical protein BBD46_07900 [Natrialba sp. SSL1]